MRSDGRRERVEAEHLRTDVAVQAGEAQPPPSTTRSHRAQRVAVLQAEPELRVVGAGLDVLVRVRFDAGRHAHEHGRRRAVVGEQLEPVELVERVDDDPADTGLERGAQLVGRLVVAVEHDALGREPGVQRDVQLAAGRDVEVEALLGDEARHRGAEERLARVRDPPAEAGAVLAGSGRAARPRRRRTAACRTRPPARRGRRRRSTGSPSAPDAAPTPAATSGRTARHSLDAQSRRRRRRRRGATSPRGR